MRVPKRPTTNEETTALFVRLPRDAAAALDRAAFETKTAKRELVTRLVTQHLGDGTQLGRHEFRPAIAADVLTLAEVAELLQVDEDVVAKLAGSGELPGRQIDGAWRFARAAILDWLSAA